MNFFIFLGVINVLKVKLEFFLRLSNNIKIKKLLKKILFFFKDFLLCNFGVKFEINFIFILILFKFKFYI